MARRQTDAQDLASTGVYGVLIAVVTGWLNVTLPHFPSVSLATAIDLGAVTVTPAWVGATALLVFVGFTNDFSPSRLTNKWLSLLFAGGVMHLVVGLIPDIHSAVQSSPLLGGILTILFGANLLIVGWMG